MAAFIPYKEHQTILEPTPGIGNLVRAVENKGYVVSPKLFEHIVRGSRYDWIIMNPPFTPMKKGYEILFDCMKMSDNIIALMPWLTIINSEKRTKAIMEFGLVSITHLPRKTFNGSRVQCCVLELKKGAIGNPIFRTFNW